MTRDEALKKVKDKFGTKGYVFDRHGVEGDGIDWKGLPRYYVGDGEGTSGNGNSWDEAFENLPKEKI